MGKISGNNALDFSLNLATTIYYLFQNLNVWKLSEKNDFLNISNSMCQLVLSV